MQAIHKESFENQPDSGQSHVRAKPSNRGRLLLSPPSALPATLDDLTAAVEQVPGVRFGALLADLVPDPAARAALLAETLDDVLRNQVNKGRFRALRKYWLRLARYLRR